MPDQVQVKSRRLACENSKWNVYFTHVSDGRAEVTDYLVVEPKVKIAGNVTGVATLPILDGKIGLLRIYRVAVEAVMIEAPRGFVDPNEEPQGAALRELIEETGLACDARDVIALGSVLPEASTLAARIDLFAALKCRHTDHPLDDELGMRALEFFSLDQVREMAEASLIGDAGTLTAIFRLILLAERDPHVRAALTPAPLGL